MSVDIRVPLNELGLSNAELTLAQLETLIAAEGVVFGRNYKVTDKNWLLTGIASNKLVDFAGQGITILNGETLPTGVEPNVLFIDTGESISNSIIITPINKYMYVDLVFTYLEGGYEDGLSVHVNTISSSLLLGACSDILAVNQVVKVFTTNPSNLLFHINSYNIFFQTADPVLFRAILKFEKSQL